jgi:hypothetical protein
VVLAAIVDELHGGAPSHEGEPRREEGGVLTMLAQYFHVNPTVTV